MKLRTKIHPAPILLPTPTKLGTLFNSAFTGSGLAANGYLQSGSTATWTASGNGVITTSSVTNASNTDYISYDTYGCTGLEDFTQVVDVTLTTIDASSTAIAVGVSVAGGSSYLFCELLVNTGTTNGTMKIWQGTVAARATGAVRLLCSQGDQLTIRVSRVKQTCVFQVINKTTKTQQTISYEFQTGLTSAQVIMITGKFAIWNRGGSYSITGHTVTSEQRTYVKTVLCGDSISDGIAATTVSNRYYSLLGMDPINSCNLSVGSDRLNTVLTRITELLSVHGTYYMLMIGGNDLLDGTSSAIWQANYASLVSQIKATGASVIHLTPTPRNPTDVRPLRTYIYNTYGTDTIVDTYTALWSGSGAGLNAAYDIGDGVHPNDAGNVVLASTILAAVPYIV